MEGLLSKISNLEPVCHLHVTSEDLGWWNFAVQSPQLLNTELLFRLAAHSHFDFFLPQADFATTEASIELAADEGFRQSVKKILMQPNERAPLLQAVREIIRQKQLAVTLVTTKNFTSSALLAADHLIVLEDKDVFGNVEPVWRRLVGKLPAKSNLFLLALGPEKFLIGPRLKLKYGLPVVDVSGIRATSSSFKKLLKKILHYGR